jgi:NAD(P)H-dependent flavin oxidoreductase YrpB (nitropropane dioxygenase family)
MADVLIDHVDEAARASHRPENVKHLFIDANARHVLVSAILAMSEMQAIRNAFKEAAEQARYEWGGFTPPDVYLREHLSLPDSVIRWVLS